jgi:hypothetical protein
MLLLLRLLRGTRNDYAPLAVAPQVAFEMQTLKPVFQLIGYRLCV